MIPKKNSAYHKAQAELFENRNKRLQYQLERMTKQRDEALKLAEIRSAVNKAQSSALELPRHECSLTLQHNDHKNCYDSAKESDEITKDHYQWLDDASKERAIETNEIWILQWYPDTPVGFNAIAAPTLDELLAFAATFEKGEA